MAKHPWDNDRKQILKRRNPHTDELEELDRDVNFFILALEKMGASCRYSCGGHPGGFYIGFIAPYDVALRIVRAGFLTVELGKKDCEWILSLRGNEHGHEFQSHEKWDEEAKKQCLWWAADAWEKNFLS